MARMPQREIDEISDAFAEAWGDYFGMEMYYVPFDESSTVVHDLYKESKSKQYDFDRRVLFHGTFRQKPLEEQGDLGGKRFVEEADITFVTKELRDQGVTKIDDRDIIQIVDRNGEEKLYNIVAHYGKVQLVDNHIFTKLSVVRRQ